VITTGEGAASATLFSCSSSKQKLDLETRGRPGPFAVVARPERWTDAAFAQKPLAAARMLSRAASGVKNIHGGAPLGVKTTTLDAAKASTWSQTVPAGSCLRVAAGGEGAGIGLTLRIFDAANQEELDRSHAAVAVSARACAPAAAARTLTIELRQTSGRFDVVIGERLE
jgi:hypothetical protein